MDSARRTVVGRLRRAARAALDRAPGDLVARLTPLRSPLARADARPMTPADLAALGRTLVVAPHPDDETFGCGGLIALLAQAGAPVHVVFVTDGAASHPGSRLYPPGRLVALRQRESLAALAALGLPADTATHLALPDGALPFAGETGFAQAVAAFAACLAAQAPDTIVLPWRRDSSRDHRATFEVVTAARASNAPTARVLEYPVWVWLHDEDLPRADEVEILRLDIARARVAKRRAIACYKSQTGHLVADADWRLPRAFLAAFARDSELFFVARPPVSTESGASAAPSPA